MSVLSRWTISVSEHLDKGSRGYMEDFICNHVEYDNEKILYGVFGVFDGHGGSDAAKFVKNSLVEELKRNNKFWSNNDDSVLLCIKEVYHRLQNLMWVEREKWPQTITGYKSTSGTTATIAIIRNDRIYVGHVGDSAMVLANRCENFGLNSESITKEHKPNDIGEKIRIEKCGGSLKRKSGIVRIVWNRKKISKNEIEQIPFLAVARSLGDLWSYDLSSNCYHVSPEPDVMIIKLSKEKHRALILASDGVWNVVDSNTSVNILSVCNNLDNINRSSLTSINPAELLVNYSLYQWNKKCMRPDNICAVIVQLIPENFPEEMIKEENNQVIELREEILNNNIVPRYIVPSNCQYPTRSFHPLDIIEDFANYIPSNALITNRNEGDTELLKLFVLSSEKLSRHCYAWRNDVSYWNMLMASFNNLGITHFPNLIAKYDYSSTTFEDLIASFSWNLICLQCIDEIALYSKVDMDKMRAQPPLTDFWVSFYRKIIRPNLVFTTEQLTDLSIYHMVIKHILTHKTADIQRLINCASCPPYRLKKSQSYTNSRSLNDYFTNNKDLTTQTLFGRLKRSSSLNNSTINKNLSVLPIISDSNCSTPLMSPSHRDPIVDKANKTSSIISKRRSVISMSGKRNISKNVSLLSFVSYKKGNSVPTRKLVRYVPRKKSRNN